MMIVSTPSSLETMMLRSTRYNTAFTARFFGHFLPDDLLVFGTTSRLISGLVGCYMESAWNLESTLKQWFPRVRMARAKLNECRAIIGGEVAFDFFDRRRGGVMVMHVFLQLGGLLRMGEYLIASGYEARRPDTGRYSFFDAAFAVSMHAIANAFSVHPSPCDPPLAEFLFYSRSNDQRTINLCVIRPDPIHFILSLPNSESLHRVCFYML